VWIYLDTAPLTYRRWNLEDELDVWGMWLCVGVVLMVGDAFLGLGAVTVGIVVAYAWFATRNCTGGHVWGEWESTNRWWIRPFEDDETATITRQQERQCQRAGCETSETKEATIKSEVYVKGVSAVLDDAEEVVYECLSCESLVEDSRRETTWDTIGNSGRMRYERCPECGKRYRPSYWNRISWEDLE